MQDAVSCGVRRCKSELDRGPVEGFEIEAHAKIA